MKISRTLAATLATALAAVTLTSNAAAAPAGTTSAVAVPSAASTPLPVKKDRPYHLLGGTKNGKPKARWNPCRPLTWAVVEKGIVATEIPAITQAFATISAATGLTFKYKGISKKHSKGPYYHTPRIPGADFAIMFEDFTKTFPKQADAAGFGGAEQRTSPGSPYLDVSRGYVQVDSPDLATIPPELHVVLYLHELGHALGLDHTPGPNIMNPTISPAVTQYSAGDLAGLKLLGRQPKDCKPGSRFQ